MKKRLAAIIAVAYAIATHAQRPFEPVTWGDWQTWGQQTESTYVNPVLPGDFSDIDCIEHGGYYYAISSTFQFEPGMAILRSEDMVNWEICSHAVPDITQIGPSLGYNVMDRYGRGIWAGAIRWHNGMFYIYFGCPDEGMFMTAAKDVKGPWSPLHKMNIGGGWDDCCPLFDEDGKSYFVATHFADGYKTYIFRMDNEGRNVDWDSKVLINEGAGREANKLYKFHGKYYHLFSEVKDGGRYLMMQRSDSPMGPYSEKRQLSRTQAEWNEPNQGGYLQDESGSWHFLTHHGHGDWGGRQASLLPVTWTSDGWPVIGQPDNDGIGVMRWNNPMPETSHKKAAWKGRNRSVSIKGFMAEDWEWNYHPRKGFFRRSEKSLVLRAFRPLEKGNLLKAGNTISMRSYQTPSNDASVMADLTQMSNGQRSGICHFSESWSEFGVVMNKGKRALYFRTDTTGEQIIQENVPSRIWLRCTWSLDGRCHFLYSNDGTEWTDAGTLYQMSWGNYRGDRLGLYTYNDLDDKGQTTFSHMSYESSDRMPLQNPFGNALLPDMIADASIQLIGDTFYCYATTDGYGHHLDTSGPPTLWKSKDFRHWSFEGTYFPQCEYEKYWAPSKAIAANGKWYIYPTVNGYMYPCVADRPEGPFSIAKGNSFSLANRLWEKDNVHAIDAEIFIDDDRTPYVLWGRRNIARLKNDMVTIDTIFAPIATRDTRYTEGPIFFKRKGIYYYLYTIGGDENYQYYYQMSRTSPLGPWETPAKDLVCTTDWEKGVFGPGHGSVFNDGDRYYLAFLEFGRRSTNRMTYVNELRFNDDGTIRQVDVTLDGVGYLRKSDHPDEIKPASIAASSEETRHKILHNQDIRCQRTEQFAASFAIDDSYSSRWMAADYDTAPSLTADLGKETHISSSEIYFVRPTAGQAYILEGSSDGKEWKRIGGHDDFQKRSPHVDRIEGTYRYLRLRITHGIKGVYEWKLY